MQSTLAIKNGHLKVLSLRYFGEKVTTVAASFAFAKTSAFGLVYAQLCGFTASVLILSFGATGLLARGLSLPWQNAGFLLRKYRDFPMHSGAGIIFQLLTAQTPALMFSAMFPLQMLGFYNLGQRIIDTPNTIIGSSLGTVFYRRLLSAKREDLHRIFLRTMRWTSLVFLPPMLILAIFSKPIVTLVLEPNGKNPH